MEGFFLSRESDAFALPTKVYGLERDFIDKAKKVYRNLTGNMGVLFSGLKGSGKSVTAKILANEIGLPIITINASYPDIEQFLNSIQCDFVAIFDEFEKVFAHQSNSDETNYSGAADNLLSLMDGVIESKHRWLFLLTCNDLFFNKAFLERPGRIRYSKKFGNISREATNEILKDRLHKDRLHLTDSIIEYLDRLSIVTIDIVTAVIDEVNILNELPTDFNVQPKYLYTLFKKEKNGWTPIASTEQNPFASESLTIGERVYFGNHLGLGEVVEINTLEKENPVFSTKEGAKKITYKIKRGFGNSVMY